SIQTESGNLSSYHLLDEESSTSFSLIVSTVCDHCKDVLSRIQEMIIASSLFHQLFMRASFDKKAEKTCQRCRTGFFHAAIYFW
ncbi:hypothetical protein, partial [Geobacillus sp. DSP4a]|uniref:hypothetical protein n=1 Tax=Geobacillus sp. DSP4a TaxID=2508873 RepID=UPI001C0E9C0D